LAPGGYADEHIGHYTRAELVEIRASGIFARRRALHPEREADFRLPEPAGATGRPPLTGLAVARPGSYNG
jgi:hypothetical protein